MKDKFIIVRDRCGRDDWWRQCQAAGWPCVCVRVKRRYAIVELLDCWPPLTDETAKQLRDLLASYRPRGWWGWSRSSCHAEVPVDVATELAERIFDLVYDAQTLDK